MNKINFLLVFAILFFVLAVPIATAQDQILEDEPTAMTIVGSPKVDVSFTEDGQIVYTLPEGFSLNPNQYDFSQWSWWLLILVPISIAIAMIIAFGGIVLSVMMLARALIKGESPSEAAAKHLDKITSNTNLIDNAEDFLQTFVLPDGTQFYLTSRKTLLSIADGGRNPLVPVVFRPFVTLFLQLAATIFQVIDGKPNVPITYNTVDDFIQDVKNRGMVSESKSDQQQEKTFTSKRGDDEALG